MELRNELKLPNCRILQLNKYPKSPEPSRVLVLTCPLLPSIADVLKCRDMVYDIHDNPRPFEGGFGFDHEIVECEVKLPNAAGALIPLSPKVVKKFRVGHDAKDNLILTLRLHFVGYGNALEEWSDDVNDKAFDTSILSLQGELFADAEESKEDGPEGGTRVEMSATDEMIANNARAGRGPMGEDDLLAEFGPEDGPCVSCNNRVPFEEGSNTLHVTGQKCTREAGAPLAAAATAGGTHQRKRGRPGRNAPVAADISADERAKLDAEAEEHLEEHEDALVN